MARYLAGALACLLFVTGIVLAWQGRAEEPPQLPQAPAKPDAPLVFRKSPPKAPHSTPESREKRRFARADRNDDGRITLDERLEPRRKTYAKLDKDADGKLSFTEWAHTTIDKFNGADADRSGELTPAEYATTAPKPRKKPKCSC